MHHIAYNQPSYLQCIGQLVILSGLVKVTFKNVKYRYQKSTPYISILVINSTYTAFVSLVRAIQSLILRSNFPALSSRGFSLFKISVFHLRDESAVFRKKFYWRDPNSRVPILHTEDSRTQKRPMDYARSVRTYIACNTYRNANPFNIES